MHAFVASVFASVRVHVCARVDVFLRARAHQSDVGLRVCARVCLCVWYGGGSDPEEGFSTLRARSWGDVLVGGRPRGRCGVATKTERWPLKTTRTHMEDVLLGNRRESHMVGPPTPGSGSAHLHRGSSSCRPTRVASLPRRIGSAVIAAGTRFRSGWLPILRTRRCPAPPSGIGSGEAMGRRVSVLKLKKVEFVKRSETTRFSSKGVTVILRQDDAEKYFWHA